MSYLERDSWWIKDGDIGKGPKMAPLFSRGPQSGSTGEEEQGSWLWSRVLALRVLGHRAQGRLGAKSGWAVVDGYGADGAVVTILVRMVGEPRSRFEASEE